MKKKITLVVVLALVVAMTAMIFTGCGKSKDEDWGYIEAKGELIVGLDDTFAPMGFRDEKNNLVGFDIDLAKAVGEKLGIKVTFQPIDWDAKEAELESKNIDCIWNGMSATPDRQKSMTLSNKYFNNRIIIMSKDASVNIKSVDELKNVKIGTQVESAALETMQADEAWDTFKDNVSEYDTYDTAILDLRAGRIDVIVIDEVLGNYKVSKGATLIQSDFNFGDDFYAIGFRKGDTELAKKVNGALQEMIDDGTAAKISKKWFAKDLVINEGYK